jgi:hypothetical protein
MMVELDRGCAHLIFPYGVLYGCVAVLSVDADSTDPLTYTVVTLIYFVYILPEDGNRSGPKHVVSSAQ